MTESSTDKIAAWRAANPYTRLTAATLREVLGLSTLGGADLGGAYLRGADLRGAYLRGADLRGADLRGANLRGLLTCTGLPSGDITLLPAVDGWWLKIGCWSGTPAELVEMASQDEGWPEARGDEVVRRRPGLLAAAALAEAHIATFPDEVARVQREAAEWDAKKAAEKAEATA